MKPLTRAERELAASLGLSRAEAEVALNMGLTLRQYADQKGAIEAAKASDPEFEREWQRRAFEELLVAVDPDRREAARKRLGLTTD